MDDDDVAALPETLFVLGGMGCDGQARVQTRATIDGNGIGVLAYTSLDRLVTCCGDHQGWVGIRRENVRELIGSLGVSRIVLDVALHDPPEERTGSIMEPVHGRQAQ